MPASRSPGGDAAAVLASADVDGPRRSSGGEERLRGRSSSSARSLSWMRAPPVRRLDAVPFGDDRASAIRACDGGYGWSVTLLIGRYTQLATSCFAVLAVVRLPGERAQPGTSRHYREQPFFLNLSNSLDALTPRPMRWAAPRCSAPVPRERRNWPRASSRRHTPSLPPTVEHAYLGNRSRPVTADVTGETVTERNTGGWLPPRGGRDAAVRRSGDVKLAVLNL